VPLRALASRKWSDVAGTALAKGRQIPHARAPADFRAPGTMFAPLRGIAPAGERRCAVITTRHMTMEVELVRWLLLVVAALALLLAIASALAA
jgi:hypothetical protein